MMPNSSAAKPVMYCPRENVIVSVTKRVWQTQKPSVTWDRNWSQTQLWEGLQKRIQRLIMPPSVHWVRWRQQGRRHSNRQVSPKKRRAVADYSVINLLSALRYSMRRLLSRLSFSQCCAEERKTHKGGLLRWGGWPLCRPPCSFTSTPAAAGHSLAPSSPLQPSLNLTPISAVGFSP